MTAHPILVPRSSRQPRTVARALRLLVPVCVLALLAAACSGDSGTDSSRADGRLAFGDEASASSEEVPSDPDTTTTSRRQPIETEVPGFGAPDGDPTPPMTLGSGLPPVTTGPTPVGGDPQGLYRGVIGTLGPKEIVVPAAVAAPPTEDGTLPLTGLSGSVPDRPAIVAKIDNGSAAAPHTGLNAADIVIEEEVEGGVTRFAAVFHGTDSIVGPIRSGRTTDVALLGGLGSPLLVYSGANDVTQSILVAQPFIRARAEGWSSGFWRDPARSRPSNLYTDTAPHWASASGAPPPAQFHYRGSGQDRAGDPAQVSGKVSVLTVDYPSSEARWVWDGTTWLRWQRGQEHLLVSGQQVSAANVVVVEAEEVATGLVDASGGAVPEFVFVGTGRAVVFTDGRRIEGTWTRSTLTSVATLTTESGQPIELTPGRTWIQLVEADTNALSWR